MSEGPRFDPTINLGHLVSLGGIIIAISGSWYLMDHRLATLERNMEKLSTVVIEYARLEQRISDQGRRIDKLETK